MKSQNELLPHLFRAEYSKIVSVLCKLFGISNIQVAEDLTSDTFLTASETWGLKGIPENPTAWLYTVAKNKTKDYLKHHAIFIQKIEPEIKSSSKISEEIEIDLSNKNIQDSQLQMLFAVCNPILNAESQIGLALRILCGFGIDEIATAFLSNKQTINKRLFRAKEKLRNEKVVIEFPPESEIKNRLDNVLTTLYLLFNEGYYSASQNIILQKDLCFEAMRLTNLLIQNESTNTHYVNALMSLMCYHASRFDARTNENGEFVLYEDQNTKLWNKELIDKGNHFLIQSSYGAGISKYHLESRIAFWHTKKTDSKVKWENILQLYNQLLQLNYSPIVALNRTYALAKVKGNKIAIKEAKKINAENNHLYFMLLAKLHEKIDPKKRFYFLEKAWGVAKTEKDKSFISILIKK